MANTNSYSSYNSISSDPLELTRMNTMSTMNTMNTAHSSNSLNSFSPTKPNFFRARRDLSDASSIESPLSRVSTNASGATTSMHSLPPTRAKKLMVDQGGYKKSHRHTLSDGFELERPTSDYEIEMMFREVMESRDFDSLPEKAKIEMSNYSIERKWMLIRQHKLGEYKKQKLRAQGGALNTTPISTRHSSIATNATKITKSHWMN
ncbi:unnamed protein product [Ambrosiozyma monospora]|uniref:Unnamed protein product n=1 Tax=Ambrosiozyma monospora TaxID=43982 RepID=A0ACB5U7M7_AMBMO|nr:unnamed protein product [Ambrosiozyma monospora]